MAATTVEVELLRGGMSMSETDKPDWVQNLWRPAGADSWQTRPGFGQVDQYDTTLLASTGADRLYRKHLGSTLIHTDFGHDQIVSIFINEAASASGLTLPAGGYNIIRFGAFYSISIFDVATGVRWEEILHRHTSQNDPDTLNMDEWYGCYETNESQDRQSYIAALDEPFFFEFFNDILYFGNKRTGMLAYFPADFRSSRGKQVPIADKQQWIGDYSESSLVVPVVPVNGVFDDAYVYLNQTTFPRPVAVANMMGRLVVADERNVYFSDPHKANQFASPNYITVPSQEPITAMAPIDDNLIIFTQSETFLYQPSRGFIASGGRLSPVDRSIGCMGASAIASEGSTVYWADRNGVYATRNGMQLQPISGPIQNFFTGSITSPITSYFQENGATTISSEQPRSVYAFEGDEIVSVVYDSDTQSLLLSVDGLNVCWYHRAGEWSIWPVESIVSVSGVNSKVGVAQNITNPFVLSGASGIYLISSVEEQTITDSIAASTLTASSYQLLRLGRGGGLDRSIKNEDSRKFKEDDYVLRGHTAPQDPSRLYFRKPEILSDGTHRIPVELVGSSGIGSPNTIVIIIRFNNTYWEPVCSSAALLDIEFPTERIFGSGGWSVGTAANVGTGSEAQVYDVASGAANPAGEELRIKFAHAHSALAALPLNNNYPNPLFYLKMKPKAAASNLNLFGYGFTTTGMNITVTGSSGAQAPMVIIRRQMKLASLHASDDVAQPVDWAYMSRQVGIDEQRQVRSRGIYAQLVSHGTGATPVTANWLWGLYNVVMGADWKSWTTQVLDFTGNGTGDQTAVETQASKGTLRTRALDAANVLKDRTFNNNLKYGSYLIDEEELNVIATSLSVKGKYLGHMAFGFVKNRAEKLVLNSMRAAMKSAGGRRRIGR
jgi:hypothetical protein